MAVTFLTNEDKNILDGQINKLTETTEQLSEEIDNLFAPFFASGDYPKLDIPADLAMNVSVEIEPNLDGVNEITVTRGSENLIDFAAVFRKNYPNKTVTTNGITATLSEDGILHVVGTNETDKYVNVFRLFTVQNDFSIPPGTYKIPRYLTLTLCTKPDWTGQKNYSNIVTFEQPMYLYAFYVAIEGGKTVDLLIPMTLLYGGEVAEEYVQYKSESYTIKLPNPCYGGIVNVTNGKVVHTYGCIDSYSEEDVPDGWIADGGELTTGAKVVYPLEEPSVEFTESQYISSITGVNCLYSFQGAIVVNGCSNKMSGSAPANKSTSPEAFGAIGNGADDDTAAIQAAIDSDVPLSFNGRYALHGPISLPEGYVLDCKGAEFILHNDGCFIVAEKSTLRGADITYRGTKSAIVAAGYYAKIVDCAVSGEGQGYGVSLQIDANISYMTIRDCRFYYLACAFYGYTSGWFNISTLDYISSHCRQSIDAKISGSYIKIGGQSATLTLNNNEVYQMCIRGNLNTIIEKLSDVNVSDGVHCGMGLYVEGNNNTIDTFEANTRARAGLVGINNQVINASSGNGNIPNTYPCHGFENFDTYINAETTSVNAELTTAEETLANRVLTVVLNPCTQIVGVHPNDGEKIVLDIILPNAITVVDYLYFRFGAYYMGLRSVTVTLISDLDNVEDLSYELTNISRTSVMYGNGHFRGLYGSKYTKMRIAFEFNGEEVVDFIGMSGLIY